MNSDQDKPQEHWMTIEAYNAALDAEREKVQTLVDALKDCRRRLVNNSRQQDAIPVIDAALDADKQLRKGSSLEASHQTFNELVHDNQQLREQLAAERERIYQGSDVVLRSEFEQLRSQLDAEREQVATLVDALKNVADGLRGQRGGCFNCDSAVSYIDAALEKVGK